MTDLDAADLPGGEASRRCPVTPAIYGATLIAMYVISAFHHSAPWQPTWKARLQCLNHTFIYALVAATFTPLVIDVGETMVASMTEDQFDDMATTVR